MFFYFQFPFFHFLLWSERKKISGDSWVLGKTLQQHRESFLLVVAGSCLSWLRARSNRGALLFSSLGKAAQNLLLPSCSMVLHSQASADDSPGSTSEHNMSADVHKKQREKMRRSSSTLISCSSNFSNSKCVSMNGTWPWPEFCFPCHVAFLGEAVRAISGCHPALQAGAMSRQQKAALCLPDLSAESFLEMLPKFAPYCTGFTCFYLKWWEFDGRADAENMCPSVTWHLGPCRSWKLWKARRAGAEQGSSCLD